MSFELDNKNIEQIEFVYYLHKLDYNNLKSWVKLEQGFHDKLCYFIRTPKRAGSLYYLELISDNFNSFVTIEIPPLIK